MCALHSIGAGTSSTYSKCYDSNCCQPASVTMLVMQLRMFPEAGQQQGLLGSSSSVSISECPYNLVLEGHALTSVTRGLHWHEMQY